MQRNMAAATGAQLRAATNREPTRPVTMTLPGGGSGNACTWASSRPDHAGRHSGLLGYALPVMMLLALAGPAAPAGAAAIAVTVEGERVSADLSRVPVADVLAAIAGQTGAQLTVRGDLGTVRPQAFSGVPLGEALTRLAQPNGLILQFGPTETGGRRLLAIRAVAPGAAAPAAGMGPAAAVGMAVPTPRQDPHRGVQPGFWNYEKGDKPLPALEERIATLGKISKQRGKAATTSLVYVLISDPDPAARRAALGMLAGIDGDEARQALTQAVADADASVRADALRALSRSGQQKPVSLLAQAARGDADPQVRITALDLLAPQDGELAQAVLKGALTDAEPEIRSAAQRSLRR
jgi:HEAT repeats